jgi:hypothetical protein
MGYTGPAGIKTKIVSLSFQSTHFHHNPINNSVAEIKRVCRWIVTDDLPVMNSFDAIHQTTCNKTSLEEVNF